MRRRLHATRDGFKARRRRFSAEHGLLGIETETEKMLMLAALNLVECIAETAPRAAD